jgi:predicted permease
MLSDLIYRFCALFRRRRMEEELQEELQYHIEREAEKNGKAGGSAEEALRRARLALGGLEQVRQQCREQHGIRHFENFLQDLRYALRSLGKSPSFTIVAILTLALGTGACTAIFSVINAVLIRSLPYGDSRKLVYLFTPNPNFKLPVEVFTPSNADFFDLDRLNHSFSSMTYFQQRTYSLASPGTAVRVGAAQVDGSFFTTLESQPEIGRAIVSDDDSPGHEHVVVLSHALWLSVFAGAPDVLTRSLRLDGRSYRVIGVMPPEFGYPHDTDLGYGNSAVRTTEVWVPLVMSPQQKSDRDNGDGYALARLRNGVSVEEASAETKVIMAELNLLHNPAMGGWGAFIKPLPESAVGPVRTLMWLLLGAVSFVLLIACGNAANLLLVRAASRTHELGVRAAVGASKDRIIRQLLTESLLLGLCGGVAGIVFACGFLRVLLRLNPGNIPRLNEANIDSRVLFFTFFVALLTSAIFGILPALTASRVNLVEFLKSGGTWGNVGPRNRLRNCLIVTEVALVVVLLTGAGLLLRSYVNVELVQTGFSQSTVSMNIHLNEQYGQPEQGRVFFQNLIDKIELIPGVKAVGAINNLPLSNSESLTMFWVAGYANQRDQLVEIRYATPSYFSAMNIPLVDGRFFDGHDTSGGPPVVIINQAFATKYFYGRDPVGRRIRTRQPGNPWETVVGVTGDVRSSSLEEAAAPQVYEPFWPADSAYIAVRSELPAEAVASTVRSTLHAIDPNLAVADIHTMSEVVSQATAQRRFQTTLLTAFAAMAMLLGMVGLYALLAYSVKQRSAEISVRVALGATRVRVLSMILLQGLQLAFAGLALGLAGALALTRVLTSWLYGVRALDPLTFVAVPGFLLLAAIAACLIPAIRAANVDPMRTLRYE